MKFLLDMPVSPVLLQVIYSHGFEGVHASQIGKDRASDQELAEFARLEGWVIVTWIFLAFSRFLPKIGPELYYSAAETTRMKKCLRF